MISRGTNLRRCVVVAIALATGCAAPVRQAHPTVAVDPLAGLYCKATNDTSADPEIVWPFDYVEKKALVEFARRYEMVLRECTGGERHRLGSGLALVAHQPGTTTVDGVCLKSRYEGDPAVIACAFRAIREIPFPLVLADMHSFTFNLVRKNSVADAYLRIQGQRIEPDIECGPSP
jgi:hypothetical protein